MIRIMVVEPEDDVRDVVVRTLEDAGHGVLCHGNVFDAAGVLAAREIVKLMPDVLLTYVGKDGRGLRLASWARHLRPMPKIVLMTGGDAVDVGFSCLLKPFTAAELADAIAVDTVNDAG